MNKWINNDDEWMNDDDEWMNKWMMNRINDVEWIMNDEWNE